METQTTVLSLAVNGVEIGINVINGYVDIQIASNTPEKVKITAMDCGEPGIIGPDIDFGLKDLIDDAVKKQVEYSEKFDESQQCEDDLLVEEYRQRITIR